MDSNTTILLFLAILPIVLLLIFVYNKDKEKEPLKLLLLLFALGMLSCGLVLLISDILSLFLPFMSKRINNMNFLEIFFYSFICVALIEEFCKWLMLYFKGYNNQEFDELYDIIVYSVFVSLGFAFIENIVYVFSNMTLRTAILRALSSVPGHACDAIFMGYYLSLAKQFQYKKHYKEEKKYILLSIFIPAILHGIYDYCLMSNFAILVIVFCVFILFLYINAFKTLKKVSEKNKLLVEKHNFCRYCGYKVDGDFCSKCGRRQD